MTDSEPQTDRRSAASEIKRPSRLWPLVAVLIAAMAIGALLYVRTLRAGEDTIVAIVDLPRRAADGLGRMFKTDVTVSNDSFAIADTGIAELALMERRLVTTTKYEASFIGAKATAIIKGVYIVKTGYDLSGEYDLSFDDEGTIVRAVMPPPEILSIETESQEVFYLDESLLKGIDSEEWEEAYQLNRDAAKAQAIETGLLDATRQRFLERAGDLLGTDGIAIELEDRVLP